MKRTRRLPAAALTLLVLSAFSALATSALAADRTQQARQLLTQLSKGDFASAEKSFDDTMKSKLPTDQLKATWEKITAQAGAFQKQGAARTQTVQQGGQSYDVVIIPCQFAKAAVNAQVAYNSRGQVSGLFFQPANQ